MAVVADCVLATRVDLASHYGTQLILHFTDHVILFYVTEYVVRDER